MKRYVLVTGACGFIGRNLCAFFKEKGYPIRAVVRNAAHDMPAADEFVNVGEINKSTDWMRALQDVDWVVHLAGRAHMPDERRSDSASAYHRINVLGTHSLAQQAARAGVKRFIFISSVKAMGESTSKIPSQQNSFFTEEDCPAPEDNYGISKLEAEKMVAAVCRNSGMQEVILRLPLVYGPGVKANFLQLIRLVDKMVPLPLGSIRNKRSFIYTGNLCDIIALCLEHPKAERQLFLVSDGADLSTPQLILAIAGGLKKKAILLPCPVFLLRVMGILAGKSVGIRKLTDSLRISTSKLSTVLGWKPRYSTEEGIAETIRYYTGRKAGANP